MTLFQFTALRQGGDTYSGEREAATKQELIEVLRTEGATALSVEESRGGTPGGGKHLTGASLLHAQIRIPFFSGVPNAEKILFARNLSAMSAAGLPLSRSLTVLEKQTKNVAMKETLRTLGEDIKQGQTLHGALSNYPNVFPPLFIAMARAGEESGTLSDSLKIVALQMERSYLLTKKVRGAMIYPSIVIIVMIAIGVAMLIFVVPTLAQTFASLDAQLPLPTRIIIGISNTLSSHILAAGATVLLLFVGFIAAIRSKKLRPLLDHAVAVTPIIGAIVVKVSAARTARTLSSLLSAGVAATVALDITHDVVQNEYFRPVIARARERVEKGRPVSEAFVEAEKIYPVMFSEMAAVGEETGDLTGMLARVADFYETEVEQETKDLSTVIEPLLMVVIGAAVGFFAIAMIMPIYSLSSSI